MIIKKVFRIGRVQYGPGSELGPRDTIGYEFVRILKGHVRWTYGKNVYEVNPGDFILSQPGMVEHYTWDPKGITQHDYIHFYLQDLPESFPSVHSWSCVSRVDAQEVLHSLFQYIVDLNRSGHPMRIELIKQTVQQMLYTWVYGLYHFKDQGFRDFSLPIQKVFDFVHKKWRHKEFRPIKLNEMIDIANVSRSTFLRVFQKECGMSPSRYFEHQRLFFAKLLVLETNHSIELISRMLQYQNLFHFSKNFKQLFGLSPKTLRRLPNQIKKTHEDFSFQRVFNILSATQTI